MPSAVTFAVSLPYVQPTPPRQAPAVVQRALPTHLHHHLYHAYAYAMLAHPKSEVDAIVLSGGRTLRVLEAVPAEP